MTKYNTGNPVGSADPRDFSDNAEQLDEAVNSDESVFIDRLGKRRLTLRGMEQVFDGAQLAIDAYYDAKAEADRSEAAKDAAQLSAGVYEDAASGIAATTDGQYFSVPSASADEYLILYKNNAGSAVEIESYPSAGSVEKLIGWAGLESDFDAISKSGFYRGDSSTLNKPSETAAPAILHIERGGVRHQIAINQGRNNPAVWVRTRDFTAWGGWRRLAFEDEVQADRSQAIADALADPALDALRINEGKPYPLKQMTVDGTTTPERVEWSDLILDAEVIGAVPGKVYVLRYYQNGAELGGAPGYGWYIIERDAVTLSSADDVLIESADQRDELIDRSGGIQTIRLVPSQRPTIEIKLTVNAEKLPADGTPIIANEGFPGWSWVIDPTRYRSARSDPNSPHDSLVFWEKSGDDLIAQYKSNGHYYRITFGPNGFNSLPNFKKIEQSEDGFDWIIVQEFTTDWLSPMIVSAANNGDGGSIIYTGGNHGSDGNYGGAQTARNVFYSIAPEGSPVTQDGAGAASGVMVTVINELMGYNTISLNRYVLRETFKLIFRPGGVTVTAKRHALEDIVVNTDNALQATTSPYLGSSTYMFYGGRDARAPFDATAAQDGESGLASEYPEAWAAVFLSPTVGQFVVWLDRDFGAGDGRYNPLRWFRFNTKLYQSIVGGGGTAVIQAGDSYEWRGGYGWSWPSAPAGLDSAFSYWRAGEPITAGAIDNADWWKV
tara:strand:+ start:17307 stop:19472 length:2166 start_codon:yes stop_codon:yes gene_type:complete